jgi:hypothetical protein
MVASHQPGTRFCLPGPRQAAGVCNYVCTTRRRPEPNQPILFKKQGRVSTVIQRPCSGPLALRNGISCCQSPLGSSVPVASLHALVNKRRCSGRWTAGQGSRPKQNKTIPLLIVAYVIAHRPRKPRAHLTAQHAADKRTEAALRFCALHTVQSQGTRQTISVPVQVMP